MNNTLRYLYEQAEKIKRNFILQYRIWCFRRLYKKYKNRTMIPESSYVNNLFLAYRIKNVEGCIVECGVWRGGMIAGIADVLGPHRQYFLIDSFQGLPPAQEIDGSAALEWQTDIYSPSYYNNCAALWEEAEATMKMSLAKQYFIVKGWFHETLPSFVPPCRIALLRLDADWYESTSSALLYLYPHLAPHGLVIIDDYYTWDGCARAVHDFLSEKQLDIRISQFSNDVCFLASARKGRSSR